MSAWREELGGRDGRPRGAGIVHRRLDRLSSNQARRAATRNRLIGERVSEATADAWLEAWVTKAAQEGVERGSAYWQAGWDWIAERRQHSARP